MQVVVEVVAGGIDRRGSRQRELVDAVRSREGDRAEHRVMARAAAIHDYIARVVDHERVAVRPADHGVRAGTAIKEVRLASPVARAGDQRVVALAAVETVAASTAIDEVISGETGDGVVAA